LLAQLQKYQESIEMCDEIVKEYGERNEPRLIRYVVGAMHNKAYSLDKQGLEEEAITVIDDVMSRYSTRTEAGICEALAQVLNFKGYILRRQKQWDAAIVVFDDVVSRYGTRNETRIADLVAVAKAKAESSRQNALRKLKIP
jgi:tetratricopeptide (TPR) repeat protein